MSDTAQTRTPAGVPAGGQFRAAEHAEARLALAPVPVVPAAKSDRDRAIDEVQDVFEEVDDGIAEADYYGDSDARREISAYDAAVADAWHRFDDGGCRDTERFAADLDRIAGHRLWPIADAYGYNCDGPDPSARDRFLERRFGHLEHRLRETAHRVRALDR